MSYPGTSYVGAILREERQAQKRSLRWVGEQSGVHQFTVARIERDKGHPTWETIGRIAQALNVSLDLLWRRAKLREMMPQNRS